MKRAPSAWTLPNLLPISIPLLLTMLTVILRLWNSYIEPEHRDHSGALQYSPR